MTGKDVIKLLLISYGFHENIKIETYRCEDGSVSYDVHAENGEGECYDGPITDLLDTICDINEFMDGMRHPEKDKMYLDGKAPDPVDTTPYFRFRDLPISTLLNDKKREDFYEKVKKIDKEHDEYCAYMEPVWKEDESLRPCTNCTENPNDLDFALFKCSLHYYMSCQKLRDWMDDCRARDSKATEEWNKMHEKHEKNDC